MKKSLHSDWLRAVQFLVNTVPKKEIQCQKQPRSQGISLGKCPGDEVVPKKEIQCKFL